MLEITKAIKLCLNAHLHQLDKLGNPYWFHPIWVFRKIRKYNVSKNAKIIALLHDIIEDTDYTYEDLRRKNFDEYVIKGLKLLTKKPGQGYLNYIQNIIDSGEKEIILVKYLDMMHNISYYRIRHLTYKTQQKMIYKYSKGLQIISKGIGDFNFESKHRDLEIWILK